MVWRSIGVCVLGTVLMVHPVSAAEVTRVTETLPAVPAAEPVLTVTLGGSSTALTLADIEKLPVYRAEMETKWTPKSVWTGVKLSDLLAAQGKTVPDNVTLLATDNYTLDLSRAEIDAGEPILATRLNGAPLTAENKGPLFLVWPKLVEKMMDGSAPEHHWIWAVNRIEAAR